MLAAVIRGGEDGDQTLVGEELVTMTHHLVGADLAGIEARRQDA
jgi:hypothetical protein